MATQRVISPLAQLINRMRGANGSNGRYDGQLGAAIQQAMYGKADMDRLYESTAQEAKIGFDEQRQQLQKAKVQGYGQNEEQFSANGLLHSGIFGMEQGKVAEQFQEGLTAAAARRQAAVQNAANQRLSGYNTLQGGLHSAEADASERAQERARQAAAQRLATQQAQQMQRIQAQGIADAKANAAAQLAFFQSSMGGGGSSGGGGGAGPSAADLQKWNDMIKWNNQVKWNEAIKRRQQSPIGRYSQMNQRNGPVNAARGGH